MKSLFIKWKHIMLLGILVFCFASQAQQVTHQVTFNVNDVEITEVNSYDMVRLKDGGFVENEESAGEPQLPVISINLLLPEGAEATSVTVTATQETQITGNFTVYPVQLPSIPNFSEPPPFTDPDPLIYGSDDPYPADLLLNYATYGYRNYSIAGVSFIPFRYLPDSGELYLQTNITISVSYTVSLPETPYKLRPGDMADVMAWQYVAGTVANYNEMESFYDEPENDPEYSVLFDNIFETTDLPSEQGSRVEYVIITNDTDIYGNPVGDFTTIFNEFAGWKTRMGMPAKVVTVDLIRANYPGVDVPEKIRKFIQEAHQKWGTEYVLLAGNASVIPVRWAYYSPVDDVPTDLYYSAIYHPTRGYNDNWNADGNPVFGFNSGNNGVYNNQPPDYADFMPDLAVGRIPVSNDTEAQRFVDKNMAYTTASGAWLGKTLLGYGGTFDRDWLHNSCALRIGHDIVQAHHNNTNLYTMFEYVPGRDIDDIDDLASWCRAYYPLSAESSCTNNFVEIQDANMSHSGILSQITSGYGIINVLDHGGPYSLAIGSLTQLPALTMNDFHGLADTGKYGIFLSSGCHTAPIEMHSYFGESWVNSAGGGVAFLGYSINVSTGQSYPYTKQFYNTLHYSSVNKLGSVLSHTTLNAPITEQVKIFLLKMIHLLGDPELTVFTKAPTTLTVSHPNTITNSNQDFTVNVSGYGPGGVRVSVYKEGEVLAVGEVAGTSSSVTLDITPDTVGDLYITVTSHNRVTYEADIPVTQIAGTHLYIEDFTFTDENANGIIEPGEEVDITFTLKNTGATGATGISAVLSTEDINTTVTQNTSAYPDIPTGQSGTSTVSYTFTASTQPGIRALELALDITSSQGTFTEPVLLPLSRSQLDITDWAATINGTETNEFEPFDVIELSVNIGNTGAVTAQGVTAELTTELPADILSVGTAASSYGDIEPGAYSTNATPFVLDVGSNYTGQDLQVLLTLTDSFGKTDSFPISLTEDDPPLISGFDFTSSDREIVALWTLDNPAFPHKGYQVYRSDEEYGVYEKVNDYLVTGTRLYSDLEVEPMSEYWYKISVISRSGKERDLEELQPYLAYTTLRRHEGFPIRINASAARNAHGSPAVYDIDGDGTKELFANYANQSQHHIDEKGRIVAFYANGQELFDIDGNTTSLWGFAATLRPLFSNPAIGDIDNDGQAEVFSTGRLNDPNSGILYGYRTVDNNSDQKPDLLWENTLQPGQINIGHRAMRNPVLADLDDDGYLEIIVMDEKQRILIYDKDKTLLGEKQIGTDVDYALGEVAVADIDNDGYKEIIIGCKAISGSNDKGAIYVWDHDGNYTTSPTLLKEFGDNERADSGMVLADIDNDGKYEILTIVKNGTTGYIYALNVEDGTPVNSNWNGTKTVSLPDGSDLEHIIPRIAVGDLDNDGNLEVVFGSKDNLYALDNQGNFLSGFPINNVGDIRDNSPALADVDDDDDIEIIINAGGVLKAFNYDGTVCIGWNIIPDTGDGFVGTPFIGDIDNNGKNEVVISSDNATLYVWDTMGDSEKVEWGSYRANAQNTGVYREECTFYTAMSEEITFGSVLWNENKHIQGNLTVKTGANLTITSKITFTKKSKIIVEPGGTLIVDGGVLTTGCGGVWEGIKVLGNSSLSQIPANQGVLEVINDGMIEYAKTGIEVGTGDDIFMTSSGGLIKIDGAVFKDNLTGIKMYPYSYANNSYVKNSTFRTTSVDTEGVNKKVFISLQGINTLLIKDNTFITEEPVPHSAPALVSYWGKGIVTTDSRISARENHFENLYSAVQIQGTVFLLNSSIIDSNTFENNWNAVYLNSMDGVKILSNEINVFSAHVDGTDLESPSGLYINNSNGFHIENNDFYKTTDEGTYSTGIFIRDCKAANLIYRNYFTGLFNAIHAYGKNKPNEFSLEGLRFVCNEFDSNESNAIYVAPNSSISTYQIGDSNYSAGNIFIPECTGNFTEFNNNSAQVYYFTENVAAKIPTCSQNVNIFYTLQINECDSTLPVIIGSGLLSQIQDLESEINDNEGLLAQLTDGGDTESLNTAIEEEDDAIVLRDMLLNGSPFLSDTIMVKTALKEDILPEVMIKDILVANPKAAKSSKVQDGLDSRAVPLPSYMRDDIDLGKEILSEKEELEKSLSAAIHKRENLIDRLIAQLMEDASPASIDSVEVVLIDESVKRINRSYQLVDFYLSQGDYASAQTAYNNIPAVFDLNTQQTDEYNSFGQLFNIKYNLLGSGKSWQGADSSQLDILSTLAADSTSIAGMQSRAVLSLVNGVEYGFPIPLPVEAKSVNHSQNDLIPGTFQVFPKIADTYFVLEYVLADKERIENAEIIIYDSKNNPKKELMVTSRANQFLIESEEWEEGSYICKKIIGGRVVSEETVLINREGLSVFEYESKAFIMLYPVPASDYFYIINSSSKEFEVQISNISGGIIDNFSINSEMTQINTSKWGNGLYFVSFYSNGKMVDNQKIVISK